MPVTRIQHAQKNKNGLAEDRYVNTFHVWSTSVPSGGQLVAIAAAALDFFAPGGAPGFKLYMSEQSDGGQQVKMYNMADTIPRVPLYETEAASGGLGIITDKAAPSEVALCLSYAAAVASGQNAARRRGRMYIGPFNIQALGSSADASLGGSSDGRPISSLRQAIQERAERLVIDLNSADVLWVTYSPTTDALGGTPDAASAPVSRFWVDNAWDTQRRRGYAPTHRLEWDADQDASIVFS